MHNVTEGISSVLGDSKLALLRDSVVVEPLVRLRESSTLIIIVSSNQLDNMRECPMAEAYLPLNREESDLVLNEIHLELGEAAHGLNKRGAQSLFALHHCPAEGS